MRDFVDIYGNDDQVLAYVERMRRGGEWGSGLEALCASYRYGRSVCVWVNDAEGNPFEVMEPPSAVYPPIGLLHSGGNHWDSMQIPSSWSKDGRRPTHQACHRVLADTADDRAFLAEEVRAPAVDPSRTEDQRRAHRERVAARYEVASRQAKAQNARTTKSGQLAVAMQREKTKAVGKTLNGLEESDTSELEAQKLLEPHGLESSCKETKQCVLALVRAGFSQAEALEALTTCEGDVGKVKELYAIDWDPVRYWFD